LKMSCGRWRVQGDKEKVSTGARRAAKKHRARVE
jgi:hypothetical protein